MMKNAYLPKINILSCMISKSHEFPKFSFCDVITSVLYNIALAIRAF